MGVDHLLGGPFWQVADPQLAHTHNLVLLLTCLLVIACVSRLEGLCNGVTLRCVTQSERPLRGLVGSAVLPRTAPPAVPVVLSAVVPALPVVMPVVVPVVVLPVTSLVPVSFVFFLAMTEVISAHTINGLS